MKAFLCAVSQESFEPKSCTSENEKDKFLLYIKALCKKQKSKFIHR